MVMDQCSRSRISNTNKVRDCAHEVALADLDAAPAKNVVGGRQMKIEIWHGEMEQIVGAGKLQFVLAGGDYDLAGLRALHRLGVDRFQHVESRMNAVAEFGDGRLLVLLDRRILASQPE